MSARLHRSRWSLGLERLFELGIRLGGFAAVVLLFGIMLFVVREAWPFLFGRFDAVEFFTSTEWFPDSVVKVRYGALALFVGTLSVTALAMLAAVPVGLLGAIYLAELAPPRVREPGKIIIELLAAIPSVVWGFIALTVVSPLMVSVLNLPVGLNVANGALVLALMSLPVIISLGEDALRAVPDSYREAAEALGATRWETTTRVVVPAARNGLLAAVLLGVSRVVGETMAVLMATGHSVRIPHSIFDPVRTLTATIAAELGEAPKGGEHYRALFTIGLCLFVITFVINWLADRLIRRAAHRV